MLIVFAKATVKDGAAGKFTAAAENVVKKTREEAGNISYTLLTDSYDECKFTVLEEWESKDALDAHMQTDHFKAFVADIQNLLAEELQINLYKAESM